jgi:hypothetical protein
MNEEMIKQLWQDYKEFTLISKGYTHQYKVLSFYEYCQLRCLNESGV